MEWKRTGDGTELLTTDAGRVLARVYRKPNGRWWSRLWYWRAYDGRDTGLAGEAGLPRATAKRRARRHATWLDKVVQS